MQLLEHFKELTFHPKNAEELKGLILQLAVQGNLTQKWREKNPAVEPASVLLEKIEKDRKRLIKAKKVKKEIFDPLSESDLNFDVPNNWKWERLGNIGFIFNGDSINKNLKEDKYSKISMGYPYIATKDVGYLFDLVNHENGVKIPINEPKFKVARKGTVLICSEGGSAGKKMGIVNQDCCFGNKLFAINQYGGIQSRFILCWYGSSTFSQVFRENMTGIIGGISRNSFANICIPIPPLEEQKAIVAMVNQLFAKVQQLETLTKERIQLKADFVTSALNQLTKAAEQDVASRWAFIQEQFGNFFTEKSTIKKLRESILQLAVQGKLTHHWRALRQAQGPPPEPASKLLGKIKAEKEQLIKAGKIKKEKPLPEISEEEIPYALPEGWVWCRLGDVIKEKPRNGYSPKGVNFPTNTKSLKLGATTKGYFNSDAVKYIDEKIPLDSYLWLKPKDILLQRSNSLDYVGVSAIYNGLENDFVYPDLMMKIQACTLISTTYLHTTLSSKFTRVYFRENASGTSGNMPKINQGVVTNTLIPFTNLMEQKEIVEKVNGLMALCDKLEQEIETNQATQEQWMKSCLREVIQY